MGERKSSSSKLAGLGKISILRIAGKGGGRGEGKNERYQPQRRKEKSAGLERKVPEEKKKSGRNGVS